MHSLDDTTRGRRQHLIGVQSVTAADAAGLFRLAATLRASKHRDLQGVLAGKVVSYAFYQPSTRTRMAFESAALRLGAQTIGFADVRTTRAGDFYQESLEDVICSLGSLSDVVVLRHNESGAAARAARVSPVPVVNAGDGYNEHPSQALGDVWVMSELLDDVTGSCIGLLGDPRVRSLHSIALLLSKLQPAEIVFLPAPGTAVPEDVQVALRVAGVRWRMVESVTDLLRDCDLIESIGTRHPDHRKAHQSAEPDRQDTTPATHRITAGVLSRAGRSVPILHPGPRTDEVDTDVDGLPIANYWPQITMGMWMKGAMLVTALGLAEATLEVLETAHQHVALDRPHDRLG